jgi:hypothetical protein
MNTEAIDPRPTLPPPAPGWGPPPPPAAPIAAGFAAPAATTSATRLPLTPRSWLIASALGFLVFVAASVLGGFIGATETGAMGAIGWFGGAVLATYIRRMRYAKAYAAVIGGVFLAILLFDIVMLFFMRL